MKRLSVYLLGLVDRARFAVREWRDATPNGSPTLQLCYQALADTTDSLEAVHQAITDRDYPEALRLLALAHESLTEHQEELKRMM